MLLKEILTKMIYYSQIIRSTLSYASTTMHKGSKHANACYFFAVDKAEKKEVRVVHYSTEKMVANFSTKQAQEKAFIFHQNTIAGVSSEEYSLCKQ